MWESVVFNLAGQESLNSELSSRYGLASTAWVPWVGHWVLGLDGSIQSSFSSHLDASLGFKSGLVSEP